MTLDAFIVTATLLVMLLALVREWARPAVIFLLALGVFIAAGLITAPQAFGGLSNEALIIIGSLFVITRAVELTTRIENLVHKLAGKPKQVRLSLLRIMAPVALLSGFMNNTPVVSTLVPQIGKWAKQHGLSASRFLMPLSFASILGGTLTLIGTSTNLAVSGLLAEYGYEPFGFFEIAIIGLPLAIVGVLLIVLAAPKLLPYRTSAFDSDAKGRKFIFTAEVGEELGGKTVAGARLRNLPGTFLYAVERDGEVISPVAPTTHLRPGDVLRFTGQADAVRSIDRINGLRATARKHIESLNGNGDFAYYEVIIDSSSPLVGSTLKRAGFRARYNAAVVAIHRSGEQVSDKLGSVQLQPGDTLLVVADDQFAERWSHRKDFLAVFPLNIRHNKKGRHGIATLGIIGAPLLLTIGGVIPLSAALLLGATLLVVARVISFDDARRAIDFEVLLLIGAALGVASAVSASGVAGAVAEFLTDALGVLGPIGVLAGIIIATIILTELITNSAAALLMLPIAVSAAVVMGVDPRMAAIAVAVAASASFLSPVGYQTNMMVYGPGGYRFGDYMRLGWIPVALVVVLLLAVIPLVW